MKKKYVWHWGMWGALSLFFALSALNGYLYSEEVDTGISMARERPLFALKNLQTSTLEVPEIGLSTEVQKKEDSVEPQGFELYPEELSVRHFANMKLEGTDFRYRVWEEKEWYTKYYITYRSNGTLISGAMAVPKWKGEFPLIVLAHGFFPLDEYRVGRGLAREMDYLAQAGYVVLHPDFRGHGDSDPNPDTRQLYDDSLGYAMDVVNAIQAVREANISSLDAEKVGLLGHSMGGGVALHLAVAYPSLIQSYVLYNPVSGEAWDNFFKWDAEDYPDRFATTLQEKGDYATHSQFWEQLSPRTYFQNILVPFFVTQGLKDETVPVAWADQLVTQLRNAGVETEYQVYPDEGHQYESEIWNFLKATREFFDSTVKEEKSLVVEE